jgi:hypothetical protein
MILSEADSKRFYQIWWPLLKYVNSQQNIVEDFPEIPMVENVNVQDAIKIRNVMWNSPDLLDKFIQINPAQLAENDLELAASWKDRFSSQFVIIRHLKKHSVFLRCDEQPDAFGVLGIISPLHEIVGHSVPVMVETVLLPFENKIIYDGLIIPYSVSFGPGLRTRFNHVYRTAQELCRVKTALKFEDSVDEKMDAVAKGNQKVLLAFHKDLAASGLGDKKLEEHFEVVENFVKTYLLQSSPPCSLLNISVELLDQYFREQGKKANRVSFKRLVRFLYNSGRIDWEAEKVLVDYLKGL